MALYGSKACRIEFLSKGFKTLLMSPEMKDALYRVSSDIARDAGEGFAAHPFYATRAGRVMVTVDAVTPEARESEATTKVLTRAASVNRGVISK